MPQRKIPPEEQSIKRQAPVVRASIDAEARTVDVSFSSENPVKDFSWLPPMVLLHSKKAMDLKRLKSLGAVLFNHDPDRIVGSLEGVTLDEADKKGRAIVRFDRTADGELAFERVQSGSLKGVSVSFSVLQRQAIEEGDTWEHDGRSWEGPLMVATKWEPIEISLTAVPADKEVGVGRTKEEKEIPMAAQPKVTAEVREILVSRGMAPGATDDEALEFLKKKPEPEPGIAAITDEAIARAKKQGEDSVDHLASVERERQRCVALEQIQRVSGMPMMDLQDWMRSGTTVDRARSIAMEFMSARMGNVTRPGGGTIVDIVREERDKFREAMQAHVERKAKNFLNGTPRGWTVDEKLCEDIPRDLHIVEVARQCLARAGWKDTNKLDKTAVVTRAMQIGTSDFPFLLENTMNKSIGVGYAEAPTTWQVWAGTGSLPDFKITSRVAVGDTDAFEEVKELMPVTEAAMSEKRETRQLATFAKRFGVSRQALINDDLGEFTRIPQKHGSAAARTINQKVYAAVALTGPTMAEDSTALFATTHPSGSNYQTGSASPDITTLGTMLAQMRKQKGVGLRAYTNLQPRFIIGPVALEGKIRQLVQGTLFPAQSTNVVPSWMMQLTPVIDPEMDGSSATAWMTVAGPNDIDTLRVEFLNGQQTPQIVSIDGTSILGREWVAYIDFSVKVFDHRGFQKHAGA